MTKEEALKLALEALNHLQPTALTSFYTIGDRDKAITAIKEALAQPEQEPVATVIEELEHDGQGWCSKVRWLYNPVPLGETLSWEQPK